MFKSISEGYEMLWKSIIRPDREVYTNEDLGPAEFAIEDRIYMRTDFSIISIKGCRILCSHFEPAEDERVAEILPCVIYLHGNCSCRLEGLTAVPILLPANTTVVSFDWSGCGNSEGTYISLGYFERYDLEKLVEYLREKRRVGCIGLWGRSMGAVTAIYHASQNMQIASMVLDSPYSNLKQLALELSRKYTSAPSFILKWFYNRVKQTVKEKAEFDMDSLNPIERAETCYQPALFVTGKDDDFVPSHHTQAVYQAYKGDKDILYIEGDHNSARPQYFLEKVAQFFYTTLLCAQLPLPNFKNLPDFIERRTFGPGGCPKELLEDDDAMLEWGIQQSLNEMNKAKPNC